MKSTGASTLARYRIMLAALLLVVGAQNLVIQRLALEPLDIYAISDASFDQRISPLEFDLAQAMPSFLLGSQVAYERVIIPFIEANQSLAQEEENLRNPASLGKKAKPSKKKGVKKQQTSTPKKLLKRASASLPAPAVTGHEQRVVGLHQDLQALRSESAMELNRFAADAADASWHENIQRRQARREQNERETARTVLVLEAD